MTGAGIDVLRKYGLEGMQFTCIGPFLVADLLDQRWSFNDLPVGEFGLEAVASGKCTQQHFHKNVSLYKTRALDVKCRGDHFVLPQESLVVVLPGIAHSWVAKSLQAGLVGSVGHNHPKQIVQPIG